MKSELLSDVEDKQFKPFTLKLTVESIQEARLLFHVANDNRLIDRFKSGGYNLSEYSSDCSETIPGNLYSLIKEEIIKQGFQP